MAVWGKILGIVGGAMQTKAGYDAGMGQASKFEFDAEMAARNAELARQDQLLAKEQGAVERSNISKMEQVTRAEGRTGYAAGNVQVDTGTPLEFDIAVAEQAAAERERSKDDEAVKVSRLETERTGLLAESRLLRKAAKRTRRGARLQGIGGILQTVGGAMGGK
jgi:hypothetical protein